MYLRYCFGETPKNSEVLEFYGVIKGESFIPWADVIRLRKGKLRNHNPLTKENSFEWILFTKLDIHIDLSFLRTHEIERVQKYIETSS